MGTPVDSVLKDIAGSKVGSILTGRALLQGGAREQDMGDASALDLFGSPATAGTRYQDAARAGAVAFGLGTLAGAAGAGSATAGGTEAAASTAGAGAVPAGTGGAAVAGASGTAVTGGAAAVGAGATGIQLLRDAATILTPVASLTTAAGSLSAARRAGRAQANIPPPTVLPSLGGPNTIIASRAAVTEQLRRRGRASTILTAPQSETLGAA